VVQAEADDEAVEMTDGDEEEGGSEDSGRPQLVCAVHGPARRCRCPGTGREVSGETEVVVASDEDGGGSGPETMAEVGDITMTEGGEGDEDIMDITIPDAVADRALRVLLDPFTRTRGAARRHARARALLDQHRPDGVAHRPLPTPPSRLAAASSPPCPTGPSHLGLSRTCVQSPSPQQNKLKFPDLKLFFLGAFSMMWVSVITLKLITSRC